MFESTGVMTRKELEARNEVKWETYTKKIQIEARVLGDLAMNHIIPVATEYLISSNPRSAAKGANCFALCCTSIGYLLETGLGIYKYFLIFLILLVFPSRQCSTYSTRCV